MNSIEEEDRKVDEWMKNPTVPQWLEKYAKKPEEPHTLKYDEDIEKYVYTSAKGEVLYFDSSTEAYDDSQVDDNNTKLIGEFPDLDVKRGTGQITKDNRMLFFKTNDQSYKTFLYKIYLCQSREEKYLEDPFNFFKAERFISTHMLNWRIDEDPIRDYWFRDSSHISKIALINGQSHVWRATTIVCEKSSMTEHEHHATGNTIEQAIIKLAAEIYTTYTWGGYKK